MSETCVRGCTVRGSHVPPCTCNADCNPEHGGHCTGCLPAEAIDGLLCRCGGRVRDALGAAHLRPRDDRGHRDQPWTLLKAWEQLGNLRPDLDAGGGDGTRRSRSAPDREASRLADVVSLRADIMGWLAVTTQMLSEQIKLPYPAELRLSDSGKVRPLSIEAKSLDTEVETREFLIVRHCQSYLARHVAPLLAGAGWEPWTAAQAVVEVYDDLFRPRTVVEDETLGVTGAVLAPGLMNQARSMLRWDVEVTIEVGKPCPMCGAVGAMKRTAGVDGLLCGRCNQTISTDTWELWEAWRARMKGKTA